MLLPTFLKLTQISDAVSCSLLKSFLSFLGNHMMLRVLPSVYARQPEIIHCHLNSLTAMMPQLDPPEQQHLIRLIQMVAEKHPLVRTRIVFCAQHSKDTIPSLE